MGGRYMPLERLAAPAADRIGRRLAAPRPGCPTRVRNPRAPRPGHSLGEGAAGSSSIRSPLPPRLGLTDKVTKAGCAPLSITHGRVLAPTYLRFFVVSCH